MSEPTPPTRPAGKPTRLRRRMWSNRARYVSWPFVYGLLLPIVRVLELVGVWPRLISRSFTRMTAKPPPFQPGAHDVFVCSYYKTGTNWTMQIAVQIAHRGRAEFDHIHDLVPWYEIPADNSFAVSLEDESVWRNAPTGLHVIKTHLPFEELPYTPEARYLWIVRDPKDVFVSSYHFTRSSMLGPLMPTLSSWLDLYLSPDTFTGSWAKHLHGGWQNRHRANVLFLTYEEMKADLPRAVERIAAFMQVELTPEELGRVIEQSTYDHMKSIGHKFDTAGLSPPWAQPRGAMVRRGQRGTSSELLSPADQRRIDDYWRAELERLGCDFPYDRAFVTVGDDAAVPAMQST